MNQQEQTDREQRNKARQEEHAKLREEVREYLKGGYDELTPRERAILGMRFGVGKSKETHTLEEVGKIYSVTRERIRQIEAKALEKIRREIRI